MILVALEQAAARGMTIQAWVLMGFAWGAVIALNIFCFSRILRSGRSNQ